MLALKWILLLFSERDGLEHDRLDIQRQLSVLEGAHQTLTNERDDLHSEVRKTNSPTHAQQGCSGSVCKKLQNGVECMHALCSVYKHFQLFSSLEMKAHLPSELSESPVICLSVHLSVNFSNFHLLLQNYWANFNQTWHKASLGEGNSSLFKWRTIQFT